VARDAEAGQTEDLSEEKAHQPNLGIDSPGTTELQDESWIGERRRSDQALR
jgi:hypothetical protein